MDKSLLRTWARTQRDSLDFERLNALIVEQVANWEVFQQATRVFGFRGRGHEVNLDGLMSQFPDKQWYFPRVEGEGRMQFHRMALGSVWTENPWGIQEPAPENPCWETMSETPELVLVPALLVDAKGDRLGFGGGYYDRFLGALPDSTRIICPIPQACLIENLPAEPWDVPMHMVVTETGVMTCPFDFMKRGETAE